MKPFALNASRKTKSTPVGEIPVDWAYARLEEVATIQTGLSKSDQRAGQTVKMPYLRVANVQDGHFDLSDVKQIAVPANAVERFLVRKGDVLLTEGGDSDKLGRGAVWDGQIGRCVHQNHIFVVRPKTGVLDAEFLAYQTQGSAGRAYFRSCSKQSTNLASINSGQLRRFPAILPAIAEQRKIAAIISTWDDGLEKLSSLVATKELRKRAFMQQLLLGKKRLNGFTGQWGELRLNEVAENVAEQNKGRMGTEMLYGVTKSAGIVPMRDHVKGESLSRCKRVEPDWFAYNPMRLNIGSIARWQGTDAVMVSGDYVVFRCKEDGLLPAYLDQLRRSWLWESFVTKSGNGSVRVRIYFSDLGEFRFRCPPVDEQAAIAAVLDTCDEELRLLREERAALERQKRGLMQRLLTGRMRVSG
jgi:type I restriction enzyme S subunit